MASITLAAGVVPVTAAAQHIDDTGAQAGNTRGCFLNHRHPADPEDPDSAYRHFDIFWNTAADEDPDVDYWNEPDECETMCPDGCARTCHDAIDLQTGQYFSQQLYEGVYDDVSVPPVLEYLECVWSVLIDGLDAEPVVFHDPRGSLHLETDWVAHDPASFHIPVRIVGCNGGASHAAPRPTLLMSPVGGLFECSPRSARRTRGASVRTPRARPVASRRRGSVGSRGGTSS